VAVPVALSRRDDPVPPPPRASERGSDRTVTSTATGPVRTRLTADVAEDTAGPEVAYVAKGDLVLPDGSRVPLDDTVSAVAPFGGRWVVARQEDGRDVLTVLAADGTPERSVPGGPSLAVSPAGLVATQDPDGQVLVGRPAEGGFTRLRTDMSLQDVQVLAMTGAGDCSADDRTCAVYYNELGDLGGGYRMGPSGPVWEYTRFRSIVSVSSNGDVAGELAPKGGRRCTGVFDDRERRLWDTCDQVLGPFSPDARFVVGLRAGADDATTKGISVLDARTGAMVVDFAVDRGTPVQVDDVAWETTTSLLATVRTDGAWSLLRLTTDGSVTKVADLGAGDGDRPALRLPPTP
jgi:hypothetical protein